MFLIVEVITFFFFTLSLASHGDGSLESLFEEGLLNLYIGYGQHDPSAPNPVAPVIKHFYNKPPSCDAGKSFFGKDGATCSYVANKNKLRLSCTFNDERSSNAETALFTKIALSGKMGSPCFKGVVLGPDRNYRFTKCWDPKTRDCQSPSSPSNTDG